MQNLRIDLNQHIYMETPLRKLRNMRGLSLAELANAVDSDTGNLSRIETCNQGVNKELAARLAAFYAPYIDERHVIYPERYPDWEPSSVLLDK